MKKLEIKLQIVNLEVNDFLKDLTTTANDYQASLEKRLEFLTQIRNLRLRMKALDKNSRQAYSNEEVLKALVDSFNACVDLIQSILLEFCDVNPQETS